MTVCQKFPFKPFNFEIPLVFLHVPKCAGTSVREVFASSCVPTYRWINYYPDIGVELPSNWMKPKTIIFGHFVRWKNHPVENICKNVDQYITLLRDPYDLAVSAYFYGTREKYDWATKMTLDSFLRWWLTQDYGPLLGALPSTDKYTSIEEYCKNFVCIGTTNKLDLFYGRCEKILNISIRNRGVVLNKSEHKEMHIDFRDAFKKKFLLDYELFYFVDSLY